MPTAGAVRSDLRPGRRQCSRLAQCRGASRGGAPYHRPEARRQRFVRSGAENGGWCLVRGRATFSSCRRLRRHKDGAGISRRVLARGGVVGGSSAGATILGDFLVRGAPSNDNTIMDDPRYEKGFAFLRGVGIDQHVVARERLADLADSIVPKYPNLLPISEDEGTAWVVQGDVATIIGRNKAFVYGTPLHDPRKPFLTLHPGDKYNLGTRQVLHRAVEESSGQRSIRGRHVQEIRRQRRGWRDGAGRPRRSCAHRQVVRHSRPAEVHADDDRAPVLARRNLGRVHGTLRTASCAGARARPRDR